MAEYDQQPGEPALWFSRFERFRSMGPTRTMLGAVHHEEAEKGGQKRSRKVPGAWDVAAERWRWRHRAAAWDAEQIRQAREAEAAAAAARRKVWALQAQALQAAAIKRLHDMKPGELS